MTGGSVPNLISRGGSSAVALTLVTPKSLKAWLRDQPKSVARWLAHNGFSGTPGNVCLVPSDGDAGPIAVAGVDPAQGPWATAGLPAALPKGRYRLAEPIAPETASQAALGWALGCYGFSRYRPKPAEFASLIWPKGVDRAAVERTASATHLVRDLINTPAGDLGPAELADAARALARRHGGRVKVIQGAQLIKRNFPAIHAVGRASVRQPCLVDLTWGRRGPKVSLVGKGVCFDSGGLDLKSATGMKLMKKDMGGAAHVLGAASMVMAAKLPVRLRVLVPAVENSVAGNAYRPLDVLPTRKGLTVEVGNTDAEGRLILCDALAEADRDKPDLLIDFATLTGAARIALGSEVPALFCNHDGLAQSLLAHGEARHDPLWRLPLHRPYRRLIDSKVADLSSTGEGGYGGAITAALFLAEFVSSATPWAHIDLMAWNLRAQPGRPVGGEAMGLRAVVALIEALARGETWS